MRKNFDIPAIRAKIAGATGKNYWRSLEELIETEEFQDFLQHEFPQGVDQWLNPVSRRNFLKLMGASLALGGLAACSPQAAEKIVPYVEAPEEIVPGTPLFFATATQLGGVATGVLAESHMGRPTKIEGNPDHPGSLGSTDTFIQASVLNLYDPDRSQAVTNAGLVSAWPNFLEAFNLELEQQRLRQGAGLRILTETVTSPSLADQIERLLEEFPQAQWHQYEPVNRDNAREGALLVFGEDVNPVYRFEQANVVVSLEADFMAPGPIGVRYARDFTDKRRVREGGTKEEMNRLYLVESSPTITGTMADHRLALKSSQVESFARALAIELGLDVEPPSEAGLAGVPEDRIPAIARDLQANEGASLVVAGYQQPPAVHALAYAINQALGNVDQTVVYTEPLEANPVNQSESLTALVDAMAAGEVELLVILEANPVYNAPAELNFGEHIRNVPFRVRQGLYEDETSVLCQWHIPLKHYLESWDDIRAYDGTVTLVQPLILPLYDDKSAHELLGAMLGQPGLTDHDVVREFWTAQTEGSDFEQMWQQSLHDGFLADTALAAKSVTADAAAIGPPGEVAEGLELVFRPDPTVWDGRYANNGWLQELPKPITKLTWDNVALISPQTAEQLGLGNEDVAQLEFNGRTLTAPVWVNPGQAVNSVTIHLGYGRVRVGRVGNGVGFNAYRVRPTSNSWFGSGLSLTGTGEQYRLASTQNHYSMEERGLVRSGTIDQFEEEPDFVHHVVHELPDISLMPGYEYESYAWGMVVDLNTCNGCNACAVACQSENNTPVVGKDEVLIGREMQWMRIDAYFDDLDDPSFYHQPMMCQHCEQAPCELVCPVNATVHDSEGLNVMVYNRCIGTRYCSNNCPYKVRRFNFLDYADVSTESLKGQRNPNVTVRTRGVMEKCTYCVQRISAARITAKKEDRRIQSDEVVTACQAACPTQAIIFGDVNDPESEVAKLKAQPHNYGILTQLGTRPRTSYLAKLRNPNPELEEIHHEEEGHG